MKLSEFEAKLATVSDAKLRQMLIMSRREGPEIAVQMVLAECRRRGMDDLEAADAMPSRKEGLPAVGFGSSAYAHEQAGSLGTDASEVQAFSGSADESMDAPPATAPDWLNEETKSGMPGAMKVLLVVIILGGLAGAAWMFSR